MGRGSSGVVNAPKTWKDMLDAPVADRLSYVLSHIDNNGNDLQPEVGAVMLFDSLPDGDRDKLLARLNFTGLVSDDEFYGDGGSLATVKKMDKDWMFGQVDDYTYHNEPWDDQSFWIGYKDGTVVDTRDYYGKHKFKRTGAVFVLGEGLMSSYYWATKEGRALMDTIGNFTDWKNGQKGKK